MEVALFIYVAGALAGAWRTDGGVAARLLHALLWPIGPLAFVVTVAVLLAASLIAFPVLGAAVAAALALAAAGWWIGG